MFYHCSRITDAFRFKLAAQKEASGARRALPSLALSSAASSSKKSPKTGVETRHQETITGQC